MAQALLRISHELPYCGFFSQIGSSLGPRYIYRLFNCTFLAVCFHFERRIIDSQIAFHYYLLYQYVIGTRVLRDFTIRECHVLRGGGVGEGGGKILHVTNWGGG